MQRGSSELLPRGKDIGLVEEYLAGFRLNEAEIVFLAGLIVESTGPFDHACPVLPGFRHGARRRSRGNRGLIKNFLSISRRANDHVNLAAQYLSTSWFLTKGFHVYALQ